MEEAEEVSGDEAPSHPIFDLRDDADTDDFDPTIPIFTRLDSSEVIYQARRKRCKIIGGAYVVGDTLGEGSYGKVKEVLDCRNLTRKAVKIFAAKKLRKIPNGEFNAQREIQALKMLRHPNVIRSFAIFANEEKEKMYMIMEYCVVGLHDVLEKAPGKKLPQWQAHGYFGELLDGLEYLHSRGVVHKDIKPGNLLLATDGMLKISDFGVAEVLDRFAPDDTISVSQGTPAFQPPEVAIGLEAFPGFKLDVWSSGVTLFNLVTGEYPYYGDNVFQLYKSIAEKELALPANLDEWLCHLLSGMLNKNFETRLSVTEIKRHEWVLRRPRSEGAVHKECVCVPSSEGDEFKSMTVIPYLEDLHFPDNDCGGSTFAAYTDATEIGGVAFITEHELNEQIQQGNARRSQQNTNAMRYATGSGGENAECGDNASDDQSRGQRVSGTQKKHKRKKGSFCRPS